MKLLILYLCLSIFMLALTLLKIRAQRKLLRRSLDYLVGQGKSPFNVRERELAYEIEKELGDL